MQTRTTRKPRHATVPPHWTIYNAPRPLFGHMNWTGDFITGLFYAAIDPNGPGAEEDTERNRAFNAVIVNYVTDLEWEQAVTAYGQKMAADYQIDLADFDRADIEASYANHLHQKETDQRQR